MPNYTRTRVRTLEKKVSVLRSWGYSDTVYTDGIREKITDSYERPYHGHLRHPERYVFHYKLLEPCPPFGLPNGQPYQYAIQRYNNWFDHTGIEWLMPYLIEVATSQAFMPVDFQANNGFEIFTFLADIDGTLAMCARRFWQELNYGSFTWGVVPLISDLRSLVGTLSDLFGGLQRSYERLLDRRLTSRSSFNFSIDDTRYEPGRLSYKVWGKVTARGYMVSNTVLPENPYEALLVFLDEIGFHPDARTVWDVIPLSFVLDYLYPFGDTLESLHPRGWFNPQIVLDGSLGFKVFVEQSFNQGAGKALWEVYWRQPNAGFVLNTRPQVIPEVTMPSFREMFNIWFLSARAQDAGLRGIRDTLRRLS